jgi:hypothetical protein
MCYFCGIVQFPEKHQGHKDFLLQRDLVISVS